MPLRSMSTPAAVLLYIRENAGITIKDLDVAYELLNDFSATTINPLSGILRSLIEANLVITTPENTLIRGDLRYHAHVQLSVTSELYQLQQALQLSLTQLALLSSYGGMVAKPLFDPPRQHVLASMASDLFVLMPFSEAMQPIYADHIRKVAAELQLSVRRADDFFTTSAVMDDVWTGINATQLIIADCTGRNPNVFYEIGVAHTIGKPVILITQNSEDVPFDLRHIRYIEYKYTPPGMKRLEEQLTQTIKEALKDQYSAT